jgi:signal transduction histidine kinase
VLDFHRLWQDDAVIRTISAVDAHNSLPTDAQVTPASREGAGALSVQTVLILGFLLTAGTWLFAGSFFGRRMQNVQAEAVEVGRRYMQAQALLSDTRVEVYRASIFVRDALLDPEPNPAGYIDDVESAYRRADILLSQYVPVLASGLEHDRIERLRLEISELRDANLGVLSTDSREWRRNASELIATRIMPKREAAILVANELQTLNRNAYVQQQADTARLYGDIQARFWNTFGMAVLATLCIALFSWVHVGRLERRLRRQQVRDGETAVELQRLSAKLLSAQEEERRTIARELHDEIGQVLTVVKMELSHSQRYIASLGGTPDSLADARSITDRALDAVRDISHFLHPSVLDDLGLPAAIDGYVQRINKRQDLRVEFKHENMAARLPQEMEVALYRIVQEGMTNVLRHADAGRCVVELIRDEKRSLVRLTIRDNGRGFDPAAAAPPTPKRGLGLIGIRERVAQLGGMLRVESTPGAGTRLVAEFVIPESAEGSVEPRGLSPRFLPQDP